MDARSGLTSFERTTLGVLTACVVLLASIGVLTTSPLAPKLATVNVELTDKVARSAIDPELGAERLLDTYVGMGYQLEAVRAGDRDVPRVFLASLPRDIHALPEAGSRKAVFIKTILPLVLRVNEEIVQDRERLLRLRSVLISGRQPSPVDGAWLASLYERYDVKPGNIAELLRRVDEIPPSLALGQAAEETGWGTSRVARNGNALFGQIVAVTEDFEGTPPLRTFDSLGQAVRSYIHNLNTHRAYRELRAERAAMRAKGQPLDGYVLAGRLHRYSERGQGYIRNVRQIIRGNDLALFDGVRLDRGHDSAEAGTLRFALR